MAQLLLFAAIALVVAALVFGVGALLTGADPGLTPVEPDGVSRGLPGTRPLEERDFAAARFDTAIRGYRMAQVDAAMARAAYDIGFKQELIEALHAEVDALRDGRIEDADVLRKARKAASGDLTPASGPDGATPEAAHTAPSAPPSDTPPSDTPPVDRPAPADPAGSAQAGDDARAADQVTTRE